MKKQTFTGKLIRYERKNNSVYGNPKYFGYFENESDSFYGTTASNASCSYSFLNSIEKDRKVTYHITKTGNVIIDHVEII